MPSECMTLLRPAMLLSNPIPGRPGRHVAQEDGEEEEPRAIQVTLLLGS